MVRRYRLAAGLTQEALAERARLSAKAVSDLERDPTRRPRLTTVALVVDALALSADDRALLFAAADVVALARASCHRRTPTRG